MFIFIDRNEIIVNRWIDWQLTLDFIYAKVVATVIYFTGLHNLFWRISNKTKPWKYTLRHRKLPYIDVRKRNNNNRTDERKK